MSKRSEQMQPLISVIIPTYNRRVKVVRAVNSLLQQTYHPIEIIVVDDGSSDGTVSHLQKSFGKRLKLLALPHSGHPNRARNAGINAATGDYIAFLDSDDCYLPEKLEKQIRFLQRHPRYDLVYCDMKMVNDTGDLIADSWFEDRDRMRQGNIFKFNLFLFDGNNSGFEIYLNWLLIPKWILNDIGGLSIEFNFLEDWEFTLRLSARYSIGCIKKSLVVAERRAGDNYANQYSQSYISDPARYAVPILQALKQKQLQQHSELLQKAIRHYYLLSIKRQFACGTVRKGCSYWLRLFQTSPDFVLLINSIPTAIKGILQRYLR
ncbi:glycosyltransferase [candidate division KSB1 bacterium]|nr:glycosyltransferase [candidate division KSB1 bacterium]